MPIVCGHEFSGHVVDVGEGVSGFDVGELVGVAPLLPCRVCDQCATGNFSRCRNYDYFGSRRDGAYAEFVGGAGRQSSQSPGRRRSARGRDDGSRLDRAARHVEGAARRWAQRGGRRGLRPDRAVRHPVDEADGMHRGRRGRPCLGAETRTGARSGGDAHVPRPRAPPPGPAVRPGHRGRGRAVLDQSRDATGCGPGGHVVFIGIPVSDVPLDNKTFQHLCVRKCRCTGRGIPSARPFPVRNGP